MAPPVFTSKQARLMVYIAIPVILLSQFGYPSLFGLISQIFIYGMIAYNAECLSEGGCEIWSWSSIALPVFYSILYISFGKQLGLIAAPKSALTTLVPGTDQLHLLSRDEKQ